MGIIHYGWPSAPNLLELPGNQMKQLRTNNGAFSIRILRSSSLRNSAGSILTRSNAANKRDFKDFSWTFSPAVCQKKTKHNKTTTTAPGSFLAHFSPCKNPVVGKRSCPFLGPGNFSGGDLFVLGRVYSNIQFLGDHLYYSCSVGGGFSKLFSTATPAEVSKGPRVQTSTIINPLPQRNHLNIDSPHLKHL